MTTADLELLLRAAADGLAVPPAGPDDVAGDVRRGRRALTVLRRRRATRARPRVRRAAGAAAAEARA